MVGVTVMSGNRIVTRGARGSGWRGGTVTVPVAPVPQTLYGATVCFTVAQPIEGLAIVGEAAPVGPGGKRPVGRMGVEYLRAGDVTWLSLLPSIVQRLGFGHAWGGAWIAYALLGAMASAAGLLAWLALRELGPGARR